MHGHVGHTSDHSCPLSLPRETGAGLRCLLPQPLPQAAEGGVSLGLGGPVLPSHCPAPPLPLPLQELQRGGGHGPQHVQQLQRHAQAPGREEEVLAPGAGEGEMWMGCQL